MVNTRRMYAVCEPTMNTLPGMHTPQSVFKITHSITHEYHALAPHPQAALSMALTEAGILEAGVPVVFLHGIGGLPAYLELLQYLEAEGSPLLAVEVKSIAMRLG